MIIASAQTKPKDHNTEANIEDHLRLIELAAQQKVELLLFPEMSLTGYEREHAAQLAFSINDKRIVPFREKSVLHKMIIVAGAPIKIELQLYIGLFIFLPNNTVSIYTKQFLHDGEEFYYSTGFDYNPVVEFGNEKISFAICADITNDQHPAHAHTNNTTLYLASLFYTPTGMSEAYQQLSDYAKKYSMKILMSNYGGPSYKYESGGQSAYWNDKGELSGSITAQTEELLIVDTNESI